MKKYKGIVKKGRGCGCEICDDYETNYHIIKGIEDTFIIFESGEKFFKDNVEFVEIIDKINKQRNLPDWW